jgi:hypothetical protein
VIRRSANARPVARRSVRRSTAALLGASGALALLLTGCAAGEHAATSKEVSVVDAGAAKIGPIGLNAVSVIAPKTSNYAKGADAQLQMYLTNNGQSDDELIGVSTSSAASVQSFANVAAADEAATAAAESSEAAAASPASDSSSAAASSPVAASSGGDSSCAPLAGFTPITVPAGGAVPIGYTTQQTVLTLQQLTGTLFPAQSLQLKFSFCHAGAVNIAIPVALTPGPSKTPTVDIEPTSD